MQNYKDLKVWEKAYFYTLQVYEVSKLFPKEELYSLTNQLRRSAASGLQILQNDAAKKSNQELANCLHISPGSANESGYFLLLARDLKYLTNQKHEEATLLINEG